MIGTLCLILLGGLLVIAASFNPMSPSNTVISRNELNPELNDLWVSYKLQYKKYYTEAEEMHRRLIWEKNIQIIQHHNLQADMGRYTYRLGLNQHADLSSAEFHKMLVKEMPGSSAGGGMYKAFGPGGLPDEVDWRKKGYVTPVSDQGECGSPWAFAAAGAIEGQYFKATGKLVPLSAQNLVDCSTQEGNHGCAGGLPENAYKYVIKNKGIATNASYPYTAKDGTCTYKPSEMGATLRGYLGVPTMNETALQEVVATIGPVSASIDSFTTSFHLYKSGIYDEKNCSSTDLDLAVLLVGYGISEGKDYWLVKNSWGTSWGMDGYILMSRNKNNQCGIATAASFPVV